MCCRAHPGIAEAQGTPPVCSRCPWYSCKAGWRAAGPYPSVCHTLTPARWQGKFGGDYGGGSDATATAGRQRRGSRPSSPPVTCARRPPRPPLPPAAQDSRSPLRNAFSDSRTPSRVARRVCSPRRTAPNFTRVLPRCRSRQVVHNAPHANSQVHLLADESTRTVASLLLRVKTLAKVLNRDTWSRHGGFPSTSLQLLTKASEISLSQGTGPRRGPRITPAKP